MIEQAQRVAKVTGASSGEVLKVAAGLKAEPGDLRGIPVLAKGVGGTSPGTRPGAFIDRDAAA